MIEGARWPAAVIPSRAVRHHDWADGDMVELAMPATEAALFVGSDRRGAGLDALLIRLAAYRMGSGAVASVERSPSGAPQLVGDAGQPMGAVSVSHVAGRLVVAIGLRGALGVDAETRARIAANATCRDRWLSASERRSCLASPDAVAALACRWVLKEALGKALGSGLPLDPARWSFTVGERIVRQGHGDARDVYRLIDHDGLLIGVAWLPRGDADDGPAIS